MSQELGVTIRGKNETDAAFDAVKQNTKEIQEEAKRAGIGLTDAFNIGASIALTEKGLNAIGAAIGAVTTFARESAEHLVKLGAEMSDLSLRTGIGVDALQKFKFAGSLVGVEMATITNAIGQMQKRLVTTPEAFARIGLSAHELIAMKPEDAFIAIGDAISRLENPSQQAAAAMALLGKGGIAALPLLKSGLSESADMAERLGFVMSGETLKAADDLDDAITTLNATWTGLRDNLASVLVEGGGATAFVKDLTELVGDLSVFVRENKEAIGDWVDAIGLLIVVFNPLIDALKRARTELREYAAAQLPVLKNNQEFARDAPAGINFGIIDFAAMEAAKQQIKDYVRDVKAAIAEAKKEAVQAHRDIVASLKMQKAEEKLEEKKALEAFKAAEKERLKRRKDTAAQEQDVIEKQVAAEKQAWKDLFEFLENLEKEEREARAARIAHWQDLLDLFTTINQTLQVFGVTAESALGKLAQGLEDGLAAAEAYVRAQNDMQRAMAIMQAAQSAFASGSAISGAASGAALGTAIAPGIGTAIGAVAGGLLGLIGGHKKAAEAARKHREEIKKLGEQALVTFADLNKQLKDLQAEFLKKGIAGLATMFTNAAATTSLTRLADKIDDAGKHMKRFREETDLTQERLNRLTMIGVAMFQELRRQGLGVVEALKQMASVFDAAIAAAEKAGLELTGTFAALVDFRDKVLANEELINAVDAWGAVFDALNATGNLTIEMFRAMDQEILDLIKDLEDQKFTHEQILALAAPGLYRLYLAQKKYGFAVDETTQALIDEAEKGGLFADLEDPMQKLVDIQNLMLQAIAALVQAFGKDLPDAVQKYIDKLNAVPTVPGPPGPPGNTEGPPPDYASGWGKITQWGVPAMLHGTQANPEYVLRGDQLGSIVDAAVGRALANAGGGGGGGGLTVMVGDRPLVKLTREQIEKATRSGAARVYAPSVKTW